MSSSPAPVLLKTDQNQVLTHDTIISIGETLRQQYEELAEEKRQRTIRSVEEVVRREEAAKADDKLSSAKADWMKERQQLFQEAHQNQLRAIARQSSILEDKLRQEFAATLERIAQEQREVLTREVENTWKQAEQVKSKAVDKTRREERALARKEACDVAARVAEDMRHNAQQAEQDKQQALTEQREKLSKEHTRDLASQREELEQQFQEELSSVSSEYESRLADMESQLREQLAISQQLTAQLQAMTELKESWETKYANIRAEFSHFIDQVPGFRGEFVLK